MEILWVCCIDNFLVFCFYEIFLEPRIWPRAGAAAERLWSNPKTKALEVEYRFFRYRDRLISRGIKPDAVIPKWCVLNEGECP